MSRRSKTCLILLAHGSRDPGWRAPFGSLLKSMRREAGAERVRLAFLRMASPSLTEVLDSLAGRGVRAVRVLPLLMSDGSHVERDIAPAAESLRARHPDFSIEILPPLGARQAFKVLLRKLAREAL